MSSRTALSARPRSNSMPAVIFLTLFGLLFAGFGAFLFYMATIRPLALILAARSWTPAPCTIVSSAVEVHPGGKSGETYSIGMSYSFLIKGKQHLGHRYNFVTGSSSARGWREAVVKAYPPGRVATCYVNPDDFSQSVVNRDLHAELLWGLLPLLFLVIGLAVIGGVVWWFSVGRFKEQASGFGGGQALSLNRAALRPAMAEPVDGDGPITIAPAMTRRGELIGIAAIALFWNGIVSVFVFQRVDSIRRAGPGGFDAIAILFLTPFCLIGLGLLVWLGVRVLAFFNPVPVLTLSRSRLPLGGSATLGWSFDGPVESLESLSIRLKGSEQIRQNSGRKSEARNRVFHDQLLVERFPPDELADGEIELVIPYDTMHSFQSKHNSIVWELSLVGRVSHWPAVRTDFPIRVVSHE